MIWDFAYPEAKDADSDFVQEELSELFSCIKKGRLDYGFDTVVHKIFYKKHRNAIAVGVSYGFLIHYCCSIAF